MAACPASAEAGVVSIPEFRRWEENMVRYGKKHFDERRMGFTERAVWYYDGQRAFFQIADYTNDKKWNEAAGNSRDIYRKYVFDTKGRCHGWRIFPHGLAMDWKRNADERSREAAILLATKSVFVPLGGGKHEKYSRETAYIMNAYMVGEELGLPRNPRLKQAVEYALGHIDQWFVEDSSRNWAPFMFGLTCEALISYHERVEKDSRILPKIKLGLDECWRRAWREREQAFFYRADNPARGAPDLNLLIAPAFAWVYLRTGDVRYRELGDKVFAGGVRGAWLDGGKMFTQNYRWSFDYVRWRGEAELRRIGAWKETSGSTASGEERASGPSVWQLVARKAREAKKADPTAELSPYAERIRAARERALRGEAREAAADLLSTEGAPEELKVIAAGLAKTDEIISWVIDGASEGRSEALWVELFGRPVKGRALSADEGGLVALAMGAEVRVSWEDLGPRKLRALAAKYARVGDSTPEERAEALELFARAWRLDE